MFIKIKKQSNRSIYETFDNDLVLNLLGRRKKKRRLSTCMSLFKYFSCHRNLFLSKMLVHIFLIKQKQTDKQHQSANIFKSIVRSYSRICCNSQIFYFRTKVFDDPTLGCWNNVPFLNLTKSNKTPLKFLYNKNFFWLVLSYDVIVKVTTDEWVPFNSALNHLQAKSIIFSHFPFVTTFWQRTVAVRTRWE